MCTVRCLIFGFAMWLSKDFWLSISDKVLLCALVHLIIEYSYVDWDYTAILGS